MLSGVRAFVKANKLQITKKSNELMGLGFIEEVYKK